MGSFPDTDIDPIKLPSEYRVGWKDLGQEKN